MVSDVRRSRCLVSNQSGSAVASINMQRTAIACLAVLLVGCASLPQHAVVVGRLVSEDGGVFQGLMQPLILISESPNGLAVSPISLADNLKVGLRVLGDTTNAYFVHCCYSCESRWGEVVVDQGASVSRVPEVRMPKRPLRGLMASLCDDKLRQLLRGLLSLDGQDAAIEAVLAEMARRGASRCSADLYRLLRANRSELAASTVLRRAEDGSSPLEISAGIRAIEGREWIALRITNKDQHRTFVLPSESLCTHLVKLRSRDGAVVFDNASKDYPDLGGLHILHSLAPGESMELQVGSLAGDMPRGSYIAEWAYHNEATLVHWDSLDDLVIHGGTGTVMLN